MKQNQSWSRHEAAILLDAYIKISNNEITKRDAIKSVSTKLRVIGINLNLDISETYRNENGIQFQLQSMESAFHNKQIVKPATALFKEIVELYKTRKEEFEKILREANAMINQQDIKSIKFIEWLSTKMPSSEVEKLCKNLKIAEEFCIKTKVLKNTLLNTTDTQTLNKFQRTIEKNKIFRIVNKKNYNNILFSIKEFRIYTNEIASKQSIENKELNFDIVEKTETSNILNRDLYTVLETVNDDIVSIKVLETDLDKYKQNLFKNFPKGFRLTSPLELRKFKRYWQLLNNEELKIADSNIYQNIKKCGVIYEDKLFLSEVMLEVKVSDELFEYIRDEFDAGKTALYYESIFKEFSNAFFNQNIYNTKMLKAYLEFNNNGQYFANKSYISKDLNVTVDIADEVRNYLLGKCCPTNYNDMFEELSHIPEVKIRQSLAYNDEFINNGKYEYFHVDSFLVDDADLLCIKNLIAETIQKKEFISGNELLYAMSHVCRNILEDNAGFSEVGIRYAIAYKLKNEFSFKGNIISKSGQNLSMASVFENFCKSKTNFTLNELKILKNELKTGIYFDSVYNNSLRISETEFVSKDQARFNTNETDKVIDKFCDGEYIPIKKISQFGMFPDAGFAWTNYLLEHYVAMYSHNYKLVHSNYNEGACVGAIVKKLSDIDTFDEVLIDAIANSNQPLTIQNALQYFCDEGYIARRSYSKIEEVLLKAKELRNQKGY